jgi:hypothetical protein
MDQRTIVITGHTRLRHLAGAALCSLVVLALLPVHRASAAAPSVTISDVTVTEGAPGATTVARFILTLSAPASRPTGVKYATVDGGATAGSDFTAMSGNVTIKKGRTTASIAVPVLGDNLYEGDETFTVHLKSARGATIADADGVGTITDDDAAPSISIANASSVEGNSGTTPLSFDVSLSGPSATDVTVDYETSDGSATAPDDYAATSGTLTWPAGTSSTQAVSVDVVGDTTEEPDETFTVTLSNPSVGASIDAATATGVILNDDAPAPVPSVITLSVTKKHTKLIAKGTVTPARPGETVTVTLLKRKSGSWVVVATKHPVLGTAVDPDGDGIFSSNYRTTFRRTRGRQKIVARFAGTADVTASTTVVRFKI